MSQQIEYISIKLLKPHPDNPRVLKNEQFQILCDSIRDNPDYFAVRPILCNKDYVIFAGNMRFRAAQHLKMDKVPVAVMDISEERQRELMIRDNVQNGEWNVEMLAANFETHELTEWGVNLGAMGVDTGEEMGAGLPTGSKGGLEQMTFTLAAEQAEIIRMAMDEVGPPGETYGNTNKNGNALAEIVQQWREQKTLQ